MECNLTDKGRDNGLLCKGIDCKKCRNYSDNKGVSIEIPTDNLRTWLLRKNDFDSHLIKNDEIFVVIRNKFPYNEIRKIDNENYEIYFKIGKFQYLKRVSKKHIKRYGEIMLIHLEEEVEYKFEKHLSKKYIKVCAGCEKEFNALNTSVCPFCGD